MPPDGWLNGIWCNGRCCDCGACCCHMDDAIVGLWERAEAGEVVSGSDLYYKTPTAQ
jgi:hypothetical protein